jgi:hypothetical protein
MASSTTPRKRRPRLGSPPDSPTPHELVGAPELAILAALENLLALSTRALLAAHPELIAEQSHLHPPDGQAVRADRLIRIASRLANATTRYRDAALAALERPDTDDEDLPF